EITGHRSKLMLADTGHLFVQVPELFPVGSEVTNKLAAQASNGGITLHVFGLGITQTIQLAGQNGLQEIVALPRKDLVFDTQATGGKDSSKPPRRAIEWLL